MLWASGSSLPEELCAASARLADREIFEAKHTAKVALEPELSAAIQNPEITKIVFTNDIIVMSDLVVNRQGSLILDLNGYKIASLRANTSAIDLQAGNLTITGKGSIVANGAGANGVCVKGAMTAENIHYANLVLDEQVMLYAPHAYGIYLVSNFQAAYGVEVVLKGKIIAHDGIGINRLVRGKGEHVPKITIADGAVIEVDTDEGVALSAAGYGEWQIGAAEITGATGASIKAGKIVFTNTKVTATGELTNPSGWDNSIGVGAVAQIEESSEYAGEIQLNFVGGEYVSRRSYLVAKYGTGATLRSLRIESGNFKVPSGVFYGIAPSDDASGATVEISGGTFIALNTSELTDYLAKGFYLDTNHKTGITTAINPNPPEAKIDPAEQLALECATLENLLTRAKTYLDENYAGNELGEWQEMSNKAVAAVKRAVKASEKLLQDAKKIELEPVLHLQKRLRTAMRGVEKVADELRGEMLSVLTTAQELDPHDYSAYSYSALKDAIIAALALTAQPEASLSQLYSAFCDLQLNIDLLDEPEDELDFAAPVPFVPPVIAPISTPVSIAPEPSPEPTPELLEPALTSAEKQTLAQLGASVILAMLNQSSTLEVMEKTEPSEIEVEAPIAELAPEPVDEVALAALSDARSSLYLMVDAVRDLALKDYQAEYAEQFGELQVAIVKAEAILQRSSATLPEILDVMDEVKFATAGLRLDEAPAPADTSAEPVANAPVDTPVESVISTSDSTKHHMRLGAIALAAMSKSNDSSDAAVDWSALREVVADIAKLDASDYTSATYANVLRNLEHAKVLLSATDVTQADADDLVFDLNLSLLALERNVQAPVSQQFTRSGSITTPAQDSTRTSTAQTDVFTDQSVTPNLLMSMMAGAYAGLATYRKSRLAAKTRKSTRKIQLFSKA